tara:strand:- start:1187 stop:1357 length:171 start_codon:yes stop_codon:yes gene_type:complete
MIKAILITNIHIITMMSVMAIVDGGKLFDMEFLKLCGKYLVPIFNVLTIIVNLIGA